MSRLYFFLYLLFIHIVAMGQVTEINGTWTTGNGSYCHRLSKVEIRSDGVIVSIQVKALKALQQYAIKSSSQTYIITGDPKNYTDVKILSLSGLLDGGYIYATDGSRVFNRIAYGEIREYRLFFKGAMPSGVTNVGIYDYASRGPSFWNYTINNPRKNYLQYNSESAVKQHIDQNNDGICGIYEPIDDSGAKLACVKNGNEHCLIYLSSPANYPGRNFWQIGDIKAKLRNTAAGLMKAEWYDSAKGSSTMYVAFDGVSIVATDTKSEEIKYLKTYPTSSSNIGGSNTNQGSSWTGTGFALKNGYIVTNNHVVEGASSILVQGINGTTVEYKAEVVAVDKNNDLALIRINDYRFDGFGSIPYSIKETLCDVGSDVFVLGYPLTSYMGEEIKLTNGIISSRSGYQGDITTYQISAPVQPGNSGGPMFDKNGNVVGIVNAGIPGAENVGYAIKTSYLFNLIKSSVSSTIIPQTNTVSAKSLPEKVKTLRRFTFYIKCQK